MAGAATSYLDALPIGLGSARDHGHDPSGKRGLAAAPAPQFPLQPDQVQSGVAPHQRGKFGATKGPDPAVAPERQPVIRGKIGDRVGEGPIHSWGQR